MKPPLGPGGSPREMLQALYDRGRDSAAHDPGDPEDSRAKEQQRAGLGRWGRSDADLCQLFGLNTAVEPGRRILKSEGVVEVDVDAAGELKADAVMVEILRTEELGRIDEDVVVWPNQRSSWVCSWSQQAVNLSCVDSVGE